VTATAEPPARTYRPELLERLTRIEAADILVIGGGATGLGVALDAAVRGLSVVLVEAEDFAKGTSSRATKLVHGGVRYLAQGHLALVREALRERTALLRNAPHLAGPLDFVMPAYRWWERSLYGLGLRAYDALAGSASLGPTRLLDRAQTLRALPGIREQGLRGGVSYRDGQFDDARLALALARTAQRHGALLLNHMPVTDLLRERGRLVGAQLLDRETGRTHAIRARALVNATGVWIDRIRRMQPGSSGTTLRELVTPSRGLHLVVDRSLMPGDCALLVPSTRDGRVLFAVPWLGHLILGTTDTAGDAFDPEPAAQSSEVDFVLGEAARYLARAPRREDVTSAWVGLRPLVRPQQSEGARTRDISREHTIVLDPGGLVSVTGGKWTTYRAMAETVLDRCVEAGLLPSLPGCRTARLSLVGAPSGPSPQRLSAPEGLHLYGTDAAAVCALPGADRPLTEGLSEAAVRFAARHEWARTVEDVLARRSRLLFLDAARAATVAPRVAEILVSETGVDPRLEAFLALASLYRDLPS
jgi:glycerol-3-phosphate dehydrogenase